MSAKVISGVDVAAVAAAEMVRSGVGHDAGDRRYWAHGRGWRWVEAVRRELRQCEIGAVGGDRYLCTLARRVGVRLPPDPRCAACLERANRRSWLDREAER